MYPPRLLVSAAHKSSGKTTVSVGLCAALSGAGDRVQAFKKGPDYIDPMWLGRASGRPCVNLDPHLQDEAGIHAQFGRYAAGADLCLVEGNKGLYDGLDLDGSNSNAALAHLLGLPVLLVIDARGMTRGIAPLLLGYQAFDRGLDLAGVVLSRVGGSRHEAKLRAVIEHYTDLRVIGAVGEDPALALPERHLGLQPCAERDGAADDIARIARLVGAQVDLPAVRALAGRAKALAAPSADRPITRPVAQTVVAQGIEGATPASTELPCVVPGGATGHPPADAWACMSRPAASCGCTAAATSPRRLRIAIARDRAFAFYYPDDLDAFAAEGADLVPVDTLRDSDLPADIDGLFIGGGFPEQLMDELAANGALRGSIKRRIEAGLPTQAECGGLMYLSRAIRWGDRRAEMVGVIPAEAVMNRRPVGRGYVALQARADHPSCGTPGFAAGLRVRAHEFHHSSLEGLPDPLPPGLRFAWTVQRGHGIDGRHDGLLMHRMLASYAHLRDAAGSGWVHHFVERVRAASLATLATGDTQRPLERNAERELLPC